MNTVEENLILGDREGRLIDAAYQASHGSLENRRLVSSALANLHNEGAIDAVRSFSSFCSTSDDPDFFLTRDLFEKALPELFTPVLPLMECVDHLVKEAGDDLAANTLIGPFIEFLARDSLRPSEALRAVQDSPERWGGFVCPIILAGTRVDMRLYFSSAIELVKHKVSEVRANSVYALGRIQYAAGSELLSEAMDEVKKIAASEIEDGVLAAALRTASALARSDSSLTETACDVISETLRKGDDYTLRAATEEFSFHAKETPASIREVIAGYLPRVKPDHERSIDNIDFGISELLRNGEHEAAVRCLESLLCAHPDKITMEIFDGTSNVLRKNGASSLGRVLTRWFLTGDRTLCAAATELVDSVYSDQVLLNVDATELPIEDPTILIFLARKAVGYLFLKPVSAASFIISLLRLANDGGTIKVLQDILVNPILLNYPGSPREFLESRLDHEEERVAKTIRSALSRLEDYINRLDNMGNIPELRPSLEHREAHLRALNRQMSQSYKEAMKGSIVNIIATKSVLLYGRSSINYIRHGSGMGRTEIPLHTHSVGMEFPRRHVIDPFGTDYMLRVFRNEQLVAR